MSERAGRPSPVLLLPRSELMAVTGHQPCISLHEPRTRSSNTPKATCGSSSTSPRRRTGSSPAGLCRLTKAAPAWERCELRLPHCAHARHTAASAVAFPPRHKRPTPYGAAPHSPCDVCVMVQGAAMALASANSQERGGQPKRLQCVAHRVRRPWRARAAVRCDSVVTLASTDSR